MILATSSVYVDFKMKLKEDSVQRALAEYYRNKGYTVLREVETPVGYIDLLIYKNNEKRLIEVKERQSIKHAIGQVLSYAEYQSDVTDKDIIYFAYDGKHRPIDSSYRINAYKLNINIYSINTILEIGDILRCQEEAALEEKDLSYSMRLTEELSLVNTLIEEKQKEYHQEQEISIGKW